MAPIPYRGHLQKFFGDVQGQVRAEPMTLVSGNERYTLRFDCKPCEMHVIGAMKPGILNSPPPSAVPYSPLVFHCKRPAA